jgi:hypothetical protein
MHAATSTKLQERGLKPLNDPVVLPQIIRMRKVI